DSVATTGVCEVFPGAVNSIPSRVRLGVDVRDIDAQRRDGMLAELEGACSRIASTRGVSVKTGLINRDAPAACDPGIVSALRTSARKHNAEFNPMVSRAYHDSLFMSLI